MCLSGVCSFSRGGRLMYDTSFWEIHQHVYKSSEAGHRINIVRGQCIKMLICAFFFTQYNQTFYFHVNKHSKT